MHQSCSLIGYDFVTHGGRIYSAEKAASHGASGLDVKALGNWKTGDAYSEIYMRVLPTGAMLGAAMFNAQKPEQYHLPRALLGMISINLNQESHYLNFEFRIIRASCCPHCKSISLG